MKPLSITHSCKNLSLAILILFFWHDPGYSMTPEEIFNWVADELEIQNAYDMPVVCLVDKEKLAEVFKLGNQNAFRLWKARYGSAQAEKILQNYIDEVIGIFDPKTHIVYIGNFLSDCRAQAVLAHEFVHYFQYVTHKFGNENQYDQEVLHLFRELQAHSLEYRFTEFFCETGDYPGQ